VRVTGSRQCIKCGQALERLEISAIEVGVCPGCGGIWLDDGAIRALAKQGDEALAELSSTADRLVTEDGGARRKRGSTAPPDVVDIPCPACGAKLTIATLGRTNVELCNGCHGMYLDQGELTKAMTLLGTNAATTVVALARSVRTSGAIG
jgi:Zn-finger nucleic acid-binding protein